VVMGSNVGRPKLNFLSANFFWHECEKAQKTLLVKGATKRCWKTTVMVLE